MACTSDESSLWARFAATRDEAAREELILRYVPLARHVLDRLGIEAGPEYDDLVSQGLLGLIEAVDRFDPGRGTRFATYAVHRIRGHVLDAMRSLDLLSRPTRRRVRQLQTAMRDLHARLGRPPEEAELAAHLGLDVNALRRALADAGRVLISLDATDGRQAADLHDTLPGDSDDPLEALARHDLRSELSRAAAALPEREKQILSLYYQDGLTMREIGAVLDISESRVCQLHAKAVLTLRAALQHIGQVESLGGVA